jgi:Family of unknown function (DUF5760)
MNTEDLVITHMSAEQQQQHQQQQENQIEEVPEIATLPNYLKEWLILEDELKVLSNAVKEKKKRMGILQGLITKTMKGHKLARVNIKSGAILYQNKVTKESMGKRFIVSRLTEYFKGDIIKATEVYNFLEENRGKRIKDNIKLERN